MTPEIAFNCPKCGREVLAGLDGQARCTSCAAQTALDLTVSLREARLVDVCPACGGKQLYVQRDFNQRAGIAIVVVGAVFAPFTYYISLVIAALVDAALYAALPEISICYRCQAHFRGFRRNPSHQPFDLHTAEQYDPKKDPPHTE
jgi:DNA-directed RNA polymerase subunit RPC12/RpoP